MSALTKPFVTFTNAITADQNVFVPAEMVQSAEKLNITAIPNQPASAAEYLIVFTSPNPNAHTKEIKIRFADESTRNTSFTNLKTALATAIA